MAQNLTTNIVINAKTGNGFSQVGATLTEMGNIVNGFSQQLISFGTESVKVYQTYERSMRDAEVALSTTYGRDTQQLRTVMEQLDTAATNWAASTIFHTDDVANAISAAAHAGWDYEKIMTGLPSAMRLAQAGSLDLSEALNYIVKSTYAADVGFDKLDHFTDIWTMTANSSATTVGEVGDAMLRMGSTMRFADNEEELMTLIAVMANSGTVGSDAGTMIRNSMMRLIAPTKKAGDALAAMGATAEEIDELVGDEGLAAAFDSLTAHGFHGLYDERGQMRSVLDVYSEMALILGDMAGGVDKISESEEAMKIVGSIFPVRSIVGALNLLNAAADGYGGLYDRLMSGEAEGYGAYAAETMMDTLYGSTEIFKSKWERLKQTVGGELKPLVETAAEFGGGIIDGLADMDPALLSALVDGLTVLAGAGPALLTAGAAFRLIGLAMTPIGGAALGLTALTGFAVALKDWGDSKFAEQFGTMKLDSDALLKSVSGIGDGFRDAMAGYEALRDAAGEAEERYQSASAELSGGLLTALLSETKLSSTEKNRLKALAEEMDKELRDAIQKRSEASLSYWEMLLGSEDEGFQAIRDTINGAMDGEIGEAQSLSEQLRAALTSAFADGELSDEEYQNILAYMRSYNDAIARASADAKSEEDYITKQKWLHRAQTASLDEIQEISDTVAGERDSILAEQEDAYLTERFRLEYRGASQEELASAEAAYLQQKAQTESAYEDFLFTLWDSQIRQSGQAENYDWLNWIAEQYIGGAINEEAAYAAIHGMLGTNFYAEGGLWNRNTDASQLYRAIKDAVTALGGDEALMRIIADYEQNGETDAADRLRTMLAAERLLALNPNLLTDGFAESEARDFVREETAGTASDMLTATRDTLDRFAAQDADISAYLTALGGGDYNESKMAYLKLSKSSRDTLKGIMAQMGETFDLNRIRQDYGFGKNAATPGSEFRNDFAVWQLLYGEAGDRANDYLTVPVEGNFDGLDAGIAARDGQSITVYVDEKPSGSSYHSGGGFSGRGGKFAHGGRATEPSIFGEGTLPEWAIPEEHSERTAALLNAARAASGFTWPDLLSRFGGFNANPSHVPTTVIYSPVIHAGDASGLDSVLRDDKKRLEKWWEERRMRDAMEVYA